MADHQTAKVNCWHCDKQLDGHMNVGEGRHDAPPENDAVSLCIYCGAWSFVVVEGGVVTRLRPPTNSEWYDLTTDIEMLSYAAQLTKFREQNGLGED